MGSIICLERTKPLVVIFFAFSLFYVLHHFCFISITYCAITKYLFAHFLIFFIVLITFFFTTNMFSALAAIYICALYINAFLCTINYCTYFCDANTFRMHHLLYLFIFNFVLFSLMFILIVSHMIVTWLSWLLYHVTNCLCAYSFNLPVHRQFRNYNRTMKISNFF